MKALRWAVRDLHALLPDDFDPCSFDVIVYCDDGTMRHAEAMYDSRVEAEIAISKYEILGFEKEEGPLDQWTVTTVSEKEINWS